jgi:hypothetical protein
MFGSGELERRKKHRRFGISCVFSLKNPPRYSENFNGRSPLHGCLQQTIARVATRKSL